jgi:hypothetical protein
MIKKSANLIKKQILKNVHKSISLLNIQWEWVLTHSIKYIINEFHPIHH